MMRPWRGGRSSRAVSQTFVGRARRVGRALSGASFLALLLAGCGAVARGPDVPAPRVSFESAHFTILCHFDCGRAGLAARDAAETAWSVTAALFGVSSRIDTDRPRSPIHLYDTVEDYEEVERSLTGGRLRDNRALTFRGDEAHLAVHPHLSPEAMREFGFTANTLRIVGHEAAHIAKRRLATTSRRLPDWLSEGVASWIELETLTRLGLAQSRMEEPVSSTRAYLLLEMLREERMPPLRALLSGGAAGLAIGERYAFYQFFFEFLHQRRDGSTILSTLRTLDRMPGSGARFNRTLLDRVIGADVTAFDRVETEFHAWLRDLEPAWLQVRRALSPVGDTWLQVGYEGGAEAWRIRPHTSIPWTIDGEVRLLAGRGDQAAVLFTLADGGTLALVMRPGFARLERARFFGDPTPLRLADASVPALVRDAAIPFRVDITNEGFQATVGDVVLEAPVAPATPGRWGLAAGPTANVVWRSIRVRAVE